MIVLLLLSAVRAQLRSAAQPASGAPVPAIQLLAGLPANNGAAATSAAASAATLGAIQQQQQQPCDRTRRVFTEAFGEISDGPAGSNYTQVSVFTRVWMCVYK